MSESDKPAKDLKDVRVIVLPEGSYVNQEALDEAGMRVEWRPLTDDEKAEIERREQEAEIEAQAAAKRGDEKAEAVTPAPSGSHARMYRMEFSEREAQCVANGLAGFFRLTVKEKMMVNPLSTEALLTFLGRMKAAIAAGEIKVVTEAGIDYAKIIEKGST